MNERQMSRPGLSFPLDLGIQKPSPAFPVLTVSPVSARRGWGGAGRGERSCPGPQRGHYQTPGLRCGSGRAAGAPSPGCTGVRARPPDVYPWQRTGPWRAGMQTEARKGQGAGLCWMWAQCFNMSLEGGPWGRAAPRNRLHWVCRELGRERQPQ